MMGFNREIWRHCLINRLQTWQKFHKKIYKAEHLKWNTIRMNLFRNYSDPKVRDPVHETNEIRIKWIE